MLHDAVHARDADSGKQPANGGRDQANQQGNQHRDGGNAPRASRGDAVNSKGLEGRHREQEDQGHARNQNVQGDFVGSFLALGAFHERDHAIQEGLAGVGGNLDFDLIGEDLGSPRHRAAVAARLANHRGAFAGDHRLVNGGNAFDHLAVAGNDVAYLAQDHVPSAQPEEGTLSTLTLATMRLATDSERVLRKVSA